MAILGFRGPTKWLSNFERADVTFEGIIFPSTEHAYQAAKTENKKARYAISQLPTPGNAKHIGDALALRPGWLDMRVKIMEDLVRQKFTNHPHLRDQLLATGDEYIEETNTWNDTFWGVCNDEGENKLGEILMRVRAELKEAVNESKSEIETKVEATS